MATMDQQLMQGEKVEQTPRPIYTNVNFDDVFPGTDLPGEMYTHYSIAYYYVSTVTYVFLSVLPGSVLLFGFGLLAAMMKFVIVWALNPLFAIIAMLLKTLEGFFQDVLNMVARPIFRVVGSLGSGILIRYQNIPEDRPVHVV